MLSIVTEKSLLVFQCDSPNDKYTFEEKLDFQFSAYLFYFVTLEVAQKVEIMQNTNMHGCMCVIQNEIWRK